MIGLSSHADVGPLASALRSADEQKEKYVFFARGRYFMPIGMKICMMVHTGPGQVFSHFGGGIPRDPQI